MTCPICSGAASFKFRLPASEPIAIAKCRSCNLEFLEPKPSPKLLAAQYDRYFEKRRLEQFNGKREYFSQLLKSLPFSLEGASVVDMGAGEGALAALLADQYGAASVQAVDLCSPPTTGVHPRCNFFVGDWTEWLSSFDGRKADCVFALDFLEHLRDPQNFLRNMSERVLRQGGYLVATVPHCESISRKILGSLWLQFKIEHLYYFSRSSIEMLLNSAALTLISVRPSSKTHEIGYFLQIASEFGPPLTKHFAKTLRALCPKTLAKRRMTLRCGELFIVAQRR